jgi:hypothetical protein
VGADVGLDITAYRRLRPAPEAKLDEDNQPVLYREFVNIQSNELEWTEDRWPGRSKGLRSGIFGFTGRYDFRAGSYIGYANWIDDLARFAGYESVQSVRDNPLLKGPFVELIDFADNKGWLGPEVAAKLLRDFESRLLEAAAYREGSTVSGGWFLSRYRHWLEACHLAADGGGIEFH